MQTISVGELTRKINAFITRGVNLSSAMISGEISNFRRSPSGHCYFNLKDDKGQLSCTLWKTQADRTGFDLGDGMAVLVHGELTFFEKRGTLQINVDHVEPAGLGTLYLELEKRKKLLEAQGCFAQERKKPKPAEINSIAIVTGETTAALQDALKTIRLRWPMLKVKLFKTPVQGEEAPPKIVRALQAADQSGADAVLLIRGGGSFEDLFCFNDPRIVYALNQMETYTVTGIGHEIDTSLADLAADHMALTPTAAAQWVTPDQHEVKARLDSLQKQLIQSARAIFNHNAQKLMYLQSASALANPQAWIDQRKNYQQLLLQRLIQLSTSRMHLVENQLSALSNALVQSMNDDLSKADRRLQSNTGQLLLHSPMGQLRLSKMELERNIQSLQTALGYQLDGAKNQLDKLEGMLKALSVQGVLERGFAIAYLEGKPVRSVDELKKADLVSLQFATGMAKAEIMETDLAKTDEQAG